MWRTRPSSRRPWPSLWLAAAWLVAASPLAARQHPSDVFHGGTQTVPVFATVVGPDGRLVTDLTRDDFEVFDDGQPQPLTVFGTDAQAISIVVMLDTSGSMMGNLPLLRSGSVQFFTHLLPGDQARVGCFGDRITVEPRFTSDQNELIRWVWTSLHVGGPTPLWGAVNVAMTALEGVPGRRVVLVFTDGYDSSGREFVTQHDVVQRAQTEGVMVYGIGLWSRSVRGRRGSLRSAPPDPGLKRLTEETGGGYVELFDAENLGPAFARVAEELHHQYVLGFAAPRLDGKLHTLVVRLRRPDMTVRARKSYLARADAGLN